MRERPTPIITESPPMLRNRTAVRLTNPTAVARQWRAAGLAALLLLLLLLAFGPPAQALDEGWRVCAQEGQVCQVAGRCEILR
jgi:hypothetical protein